MDTPVDASLRSRTLRHVRQYHYEVGGGPFLTGVTDENLSRYSTFGYDSLLKPTSTELAGGVNRYSVHYTNTWSRSVTDPLGKQRSYSLGILWNALRETAVASTCAGCTEPKSVTYDVNANIASTRDFNNNLTCSAHDLTRNLETVRVEGFAPAVASCPANLASYTPASGTRQRKITTSWHSTFRIPTSIVEANRTTRSRTTPNGNVLTRTVTDTPSPECLAHLDLHLQLLRPGADRRRSAHRCLRRHDLHLLQLHDGLSVRPAAYDHERARPLTTYNTTTPTASRLRSRMPNGLVTTLAYDARQRLTDRCIGGTLPAARAASSRTSTTGRRDC